MPEQSKTTELSEAISRVVHDWKTQHRHTFDDASQAFSAMSMTVLDYWTDLHKEATDTLSTADRLRSVEHIMNVMSGIDFRLALLHMEKQNDASGNLANRMLFLTVVMLFAVFTQIVIAIMQLSRAV